MSHVRQFDRAAACLPAGLHERYAQFVIVIFVECEIATAASAGQPRSEGCVLNDPWVPLAVKSVSTNVIPDMETFRRSPMSTIRLVVGTNNFGTSLDRTVIVWATASTAQIPLVVGVSASMRTSPKKITRLPGERPILEFG